MTAREAISPFTGNDSGTSADSVDVGMHLLDVLPKLLESPSRLLSVTDDGSVAGTIDQSSMLEALARMIPARYDCSVIELDCAPADYSASHLARAVEDSDVHLVDLLTAPGPDGRLHVTLRVRCDDPTSTVHSLERYGYDVDNVFSRSDAPDVVSYERLLALRTLLNV